MESQQAEERITKAPANAHCAREVRLDPAGKPVYCVLKASLVVRGRPLCQKHANEAMMAIAIEKGL